MPKSVLVVDDDVRIRKMITRYLHENKLKFLEAENGVEALRVLEQEAVSLVLLDLMMPEMDGEATIKAIRQFSDIYIIVLTAKTGEDAQLYTYALGADDYIEKPFNIKTLMAKIQAVFARLDQKVYGKKNVSLKGIRCDKASRIVYADDVDCHLKPKEFELLEYFLLNQNVAVSRDQIIESVWGMDYFGNDRTVDIHVSNLRRKLGRRGVYIKTLKGFGYMFEVAYEE